MPYVQRTKATKGYVGFIWFYEVIMYVVEMWFVRNPCPSPLKIQWRLHGQFHKMDPRNARVLRTPYKITATATFKRDQIITVNWSEKQSPKKQRFYVIVPYSEFWQQLIMLPVIHGYTIHVYPHYITNNMVFVFFYCHCPSNTHDINFTCAMITSSMSGWPGVTQSDLLYMSLLSK